MGLTRIQPVGKKALKILRINEIVIREGGFDSASQVTVLQNLARGLPVNFQLFVSENISKLPTHAKRWDGL